MNARAPSSLSLKLERLLKVQSSLLTSPVAEVSPSMWAPSSVCPLLAAHLLSKPGYYQNRIVWAPPHFLTDARANRGGDGSAPPTKQPLCKPALRFLNLGGAHEDGLVPVLNAAFLHETSLFALLLWHPLPCSPLSRVSGVPERPSASMDASHLVHASVPLMPARHYWMQQGRWRVCAPGSDGETWLAAATPAINVQLSFSSNVFFDDVAHVQSGDGREITDPADRYTCAARGGLASGDYLENLVWPTECSSDARPGVTADCVWVDAATLRRYSLGYYSDAIWVPLHPSCTFASWNRKQVLRYSRCVAKFPSVEDERAEQHGSPNPTGDGHAIENNASIGRLGELYVCSL
ncbi:hypothetical protein ABL78_0675 [Leptomonas seymouri]|uniref:Uncharacterized protein n=1 Tax=Leptomonas seymouri TaxID=5684 RepID=A0A0N0P910_LEPSE|nr:hypothetical protein ABL78_0675 [Leptomonas seymouri]|eukprot:KPI90157.1 hypothetical protein ABL78_0675 [Leptomonas seymouri]